MGVGLCRASQVSVTWKYQDGLDIVHPQVNTSWVIHVDHPHTCQIGPSQNPGDVQGLEKSNWPYGVHLGHTFLISNLGLDTAKIVPLSWAPTPALTTFPLGWRRKKNKQHWNIESRCFKKFPKPTIQKKNKSRPCDSFAMPAFNLWGLTACEQGIKDEICLAQKVLGHGGLYLRLEENQIHQLCLEIV